MQALIHSLWYRSHPLRWLLLPLAGLFWLLSSCRHKLYGLGWLTSYHPGVPVLVVGNISVGGNGKTPVVLAVVQWLVEAGYRPGVLSRGYGGKCESFPHAVVRTDPAALVGDEPALMASRDLCPVVIDPKRARGASHLVSMGCNVIVCDDGLQHFALDRDLEWVVMDDRGVGNGALLPMGPLRERSNRLQTVDAVIHNGEQPYWHDTYPMQLRPKLFRRVSDKNSVLTADELTQRYSEGVNAMAGIGNPTRFFNTLNDLGITVADAQAFDDHHQFSRADLPAQVTIMTEKDAVKCLEFAHDDWWYLEVTAELPDALRQHLLDKLRHIASNVASKTKSK